MTRWMLMLGAAGLLAGCEAGFEDLRPGAGLAPGDAGTVAPGGPDLGGGFDLGGGDLGVAPDLGGGVDQGPAGEDTVLATGAFVPVDYDIAGRAEVVRLADGTLELRLSPDFRSFPVPGPVVVLTTRDRIGSRINPAAGDLRISDLRVNSGAQTYALPEAAASAGYVFIYCEPFGLEVGVAALTPGG